MKVGDVVWYVPYNSRGEEYAQGKNITITRVGRIYAYAQETWREHKINIATRVSYDERNDSEGRVFASQAEHTLERLRHAEWKRLQEYVSRCYNAPSDVTLQDILYIQVLLKIREAEVAPRPPRAERAYGPVMEPFYHD